MIKYTYQIYQIVLLERQGQWPIVLLGFKADAVELDTRIGEGILDILRKKNKYPYSIIS